MFENIIPYINRHDNILILPHINEDGDSLGSAFALRLVLTSMGKRAFVMLSAYHGYCNFLYGTQDNTPLDEYSLAISVDCAGIERLGERKAYFEGCNEKVVIDHHATNVGYGDENVIIAKASSCGELIFHLAKELGVAITPEIATNIYLAISSDSGGFRYSNVSPDTMRIGGELLECGAQSVKVNELLFESETMEKLTLMKYALASLETFNNGKVACITITHDQFLQSGAKPEEMDGLVNIPRSLDTADIAVFLRERADGTIKASLRGNENADVSKICAFFGGGGHIRAAGCEFTCTIDEAKRQIIEKCII
ncbi:MAG: bifunctional oligoribonuclease/PAP phosphatase NrnA [Eubacteriales bacterium]|nr:bifunctional oligoribonuclease/PAP phosphatase NrnA [Eubacteriales bacterium]